MKLFKTLSTIAVLSLNVTFAVPVSAQTFLNLKDVLNTRERDRAAEVTQDSEFEINAKSVGNFYINPLQLDGHELNYSEFNLGAEGELTLVKGNAVTGNPMLIPFYIYLRRDGKILELKSDKTMKRKHFKLEISRILKLAEPGDQLIIKPANKEDWQAKRILKLLGGC
jgi:hypothetical protein